jgi:hypothetical protein
MHNNNSQHNVPQQLDLFNGAFSSFDTKISKKDLLRTLNNASYVCTKCGIAFSEPSSVAAVFATFHIGHCDVCQNPNVSVTSVRDFGYLRHGIDAVEKMLSVDEAGKQTKPKKSGRRRSDSLIGNFMDLCDKKGI